MNPTKEQADEAGRRPGVPHINKRTGLREYVTGPDTSLVRKARKVRARALTLARQKGVLA